jgi:hypothetical protein
MVDLPWQLSLAFRYQKSKIGSGNFLLINLVYAERDFGSFPDLLTTTKSCLPMVKYRGFDFVLK